MNILRSQKNTPHQTDMNQVLGAYANRWVSAGMNIFSAIDTVIGRILSRARSLYNVSINPLPYLK